MLKSSGAPHEFRWVSLTDDSVAEQLLIYENRGNLPRVFNVVSTEVSDIRSRTHSPLRYPQLRVTTST